MSVNPKDVIVALDDGHGMETPGKRTPLFKDGTFMKENEFNRAVVMLVYKKLNAKGFNTLLVAPTNADTPLKDRTDLANNTTKNKYNKPATIYVSVHANALSGTWEKHGNGIETFYHPNASANGIRLAQTIHKYIMQGTKFVDRGCKPDNLFVLRETHMPAALVECGFMDDIKEAELLRSGAYREECATEIVKAICEYFGIKY